MGNYPDNHSKGCKICQEGKWLCVYLTYMCKASCSFCPAPSRSKDIIRSVLGNDPIEVLKYVEQYAFKGISFSGGECFMVFDRMLHWLKTLRTQKPELYYWAYTNGMDISKEQLETLGSNGLNELRFNIAATGYTNSEVLETIRVAGKIFQHVAVEIPSVPEDLETLFGILQELVNAGVDYLNLHEYILVPGDPNTNSAPAGSFIMNHEMRMRYHLRSLENTGRIKDFCEKNGIPLQINNCSLMKKEHQMKGRRLTMGAITQKGHERLNDEGFLETIYVPGSQVSDQSENLKDYSRIDRSLLLHPERFDQKSESAYLLKLLPAMDLVSGPRIIQYRSIHAT